MIIISLVFYIYTYTSLHIHQCIQRYIDLSIHLHIVVYLSHCILQTTGHISDNNTNDNNCYTRRNNIIEWYL